MGIVSCDILVKTMLEAAFADLRKNAWLLDDVYGELAQDTLAYKDFGYKEVAAAKAWFLNNNIDVYMSNRSPDTPRFPCVTLVQTGSREMTERTALSDEDSVEYEDVDPKSITKRIQKVYDNFTPSAYDPSKGYVTFPEGTTTTYINPGQFLVTKDGKAYAIGAALDLRTFQIAPNLKLNLTDCYIAPPTSIWNLHKELTFMQESLVIGLHAQSDVNQMLWFRQLMSYILLRYKEAFLERRGFELSTFNVGSIEENPHFNGVELIWTCPVTLTGQVEANFIKFAAPKLQAVKGGVRIIDGPKTPDTMFQYAEAQGWIMQNDPPQPVPVVVPPVETKDEE